jgi:hypothetical protein
MSKQTGDADKILDQMDMQACLNGTPKTYLKTVTKYKPID